MFNVVLYKTKTGYSELRSQIKYLKDRFLTSKDARIQLNEIEFEIELLKKSGTNVPPNIAKHITGSIWELRPGKNRILFFFDKGEATFVLLHMFAKKTQKTPKQEIERAKREMNDYISRKETK